MWLWIEKIKPIRILRFCRIPRIYRSSGRAGTPDQCQVRTPGLERIKMFLKIIFITFWKNNLHVPGRAFPPGTSPGVRAWAWMDKTLADKFAPGLEIEQARHKTCGSYSIHVSKSVTSHNPDAEDHLYLSGESTKPALTGFSWMYFKAALLFSGVSMWNLSCQKGPIPRLWLTPDLNCLIITEIVSGGGTLSKMWQWSGIITKPNKKKGWSVCRR